MNNITIREMAVVEERGGYHNDVRFKVKGKLIVNEKVFDFSSTCGAVNFEGRNTLENVGFSFKKIDDTVTEMINQVKEKHRKAEENRKAKERELKWSTLPINAVFAELSKQLPCGLTVTKETYVNNGQMPGVILNQSYKGKTVLIRIRYDEYYGRFEIFNETEGRQNKYDAVFKSKGVVKNLVSKFVEEFSSAKNLIDYNIDREKNKQNKVERLRKLLQCDVSVEKVWHSSNSRRSGGYETDIFVACKEGVKDRKIKFNYEKEFSVAGISFNMTLEQMKKLIEMI